MLKLEFVPAAGDKLVLKLSPPPPLADKQVCVNLQWLREQGVCTRTAATHATLRFTCKPLSLQDYPLAFCG